MKINTLYGFLAIIISLGTSINVNAFTVYSDEFVSHSAEVDTRGCHIDNNGVFHCH